MTQPVSACLGHKVREVRRNKITKLSSSSPMTPDEQFRVLIKKGPVSVETSLKELEANYEKTPEWKLIEDGGVLVVPVEELRMNNIPKPNHSGQIVFQEKKGGGGRHIENYPVGQTVENINEMLREKYDEEKQKANASGMSESECKEKAIATTTKLPQYQAVKAWQDSLAEIKLKKALERMMVRLKIPAIVIRSIKLKQISALKELGLKLPEDAEIDLIMAYSSRSLLHVNIFEVKRNDTYAWDTKTRPPNKQAVNKAENQLTKDVDIVMALLAGTSPDQIVFHSLACYPDSLIKDLNAIFCADCLENGVICQEDLNDLSLLQKKTLVPDKPDPATTNGKQHLLRFTARCLSIQSLLHIGFRTIKDQELLVNERHMFNTQTVDEKMGQRVYVTASPQQQRAIESFDISSSQKHLVLTGLAGTGKTLVASHVANNIIQALEGNAEPGKGPGLVLSTAYDLPHLLKYLDVNTPNAKTKLRVWRKYNTSSQKELDILHLCDDVIQRWDGRPLIILMDEIIYPYHTLRCLTEKDTSIPDGVTIIAVVNPRNSSDLPALPESVLHINLTTPYRSTIAITSLARFLAKCWDLDVPEVELGSDIEGGKAIAFVVGGDKVKLTLALQKSLELMGTEATLLYDDYSLPTSTQEICESHNKIKGGPWECHRAWNFFGWEAEKVIAVVGGPGPTIEMITRARTRLILILAEPKRAKEWYTETQNWFRAAANSGLLDLQEEAVDLEVTTSEDEIENTNGSLCACCALL